MRGRVILCQRVTGSVSLCAALLLCGGCAYRPPPVPPAEVIQPPGGRLVCADNSVLIREEGSCDKSSQPSPSSENTGVAPRRPMRRIPPAAVAVAAQHRRERKAATVAAEPSVPQSTADAMFTLKNAPVKNASVGSVFLGVPATFSSNPLVRLFHATARVERPGGSAIGETADSARAISAPWGGVAIPSRGSSSPWSRSSGDRDSAAEAARRSPRCAQPLKQPPRAPPPRLLA